MHFCTFNSASEARQGEARQGGEAYGDGPACGSAAAIHVHAHVAERERQQNAGEEELNLSAD